MTTITYGAKIEGSGNNIDLDLINKDSDFNISIVKFGDGYILGKVLVSSEKDATEFYLSDLDVTFGLVDCIYKTVTEHNIKFENIKYWLVQEV